MNKKIIIFVFALLIAGAGIYFYFNFPQEEAEQNRLEELKQQRPEWAEFIDRIAAWEGEVSKDENNIEAYNALGLAWKSLADRARDSQTDNYRDFYLRALEAYKKGIEITGGKNTLFITNAGTIAKFLGEYDLAEKYYRDAISASPGEAPYYVWLAELYEYKMGKTKEEIVAVYDEGLKRVISRDFLQKRKESYLRRAEGK